MPADPRYTTDCAKIAINKRLKTMTRAEREEMTRPAREAYLRKIEDEVDPDRSLLPQERARPGERGRALVTRTRPRSRGFD
jgi:hypothetical protein